MKIINDEDLSKHVTIKIGGVASRFYIPESLDDIKELLLNENEFHLLGGGSNLLIDDNAIFPCVIDTRSMNRRMELLSDDEIYVGASNRIQSVINFAVNNNLGGFEFLYSLPALMGGIVYMNAGRGSDRKCIADYIISVDYINESGELITLNKDQLEFSWRKSIFHNHDKWIIWGVRLKCVKQESEIGKKLISERIEFCKNFQDLRYPNFGSVFFIANTTIMNTVRKLSKLFINRNSCEVCFSDKTNNWICNKGGEFKKVIRLIRRVELLHKLLGKKCEKEICIWSRK